MKSLIRSFYYNDYSVANAPFLLLNIKKQKNTYLR